MSKVKQRLSSEASPLRLLKVLKASYVTEKITNNSQGGYQQFGFKVAQDATKPEIKQAVEHVFNVQVKSVAVSRVKPKARRFGQRTGYKKGWKKAYVTLHKGQEVIEDILARM